MIQIFLIIGFYSYNWIAQISQDSLIFEFLRTSIEPYQDYQIWYKSFVENFLHEDWLPYSFSFPDIDLYDDLYSFLWDLFIGIRQYFYIYPPFFLYILSLPGLFNINLIFIPLLSATNLLPIVMYKFLSTFFKEKVAEWGFLATTFCPLLIFYNGGLLLNTSLVTLFFMITLYLIATNKFKSACVFLAISFLFKQIILFFILPALAYIVLQSCKDKKGRLIIIYFKNLLIYSSIIIGTIFLGSLPWIIINPRGYVTTILVSQGITFNPIFKVPHHNSPVYWYSFLTALGFPNWLLYIVGFLTFTFIGIIILEIIIVILLHYWYNKNNLNWLRFLDIIVYTAFLTHLFFPRGVYKYYFTFHIPLIILWFCHHFIEIYSEKHSKRKRWLLYFIVISLIILIIPRIYYLLLIWAIIIIMIRKNLIRNRNIKI